MTNKISVIINTYNEELNIQRAIKSVSWADEVLVCDMHSTDQTVELAKRMGAKIVYHKHTGFVEPARNYAISKTSSDWILILDADEEIPPTLAVFLQDLVKKEVHANFLEIPRKNLIFSKWMRSAMWWPDYNIRFFKKGSVSWSDQIHSRPATVGIGMTLPDDSKWAIVHHHYTSVSQFVERMNRYSGVQAKELHINGTRFKWIDLLNKPLAEFLARYFDQKGFKDGVHGLGLSLLQAASFVLVYLKLWEYEKFREIDIPFKSLENEIKGSGSQVSYWLKYGNLPENKIKRLFVKFKNKIS